MVPGCGAAFWWQLHRALGGNALSWAYTFEWPIFAVLGVIAWWQLVHDDPDTVGHRARARPARADEPSPAPAPPPWEDDPAGDPERAAYNRYLAGLATSGRRKSWRHP